ncbi:MAG TPA: hypothetical protein VHR84_02275 [Terriglobales bacterium]|jgi:hypothetical protein|nr:hypothetical protein [Terriglobales bacterium]
MKLATVITNLSSELAYTVLMVMTWIMLLGWSAAVISACVLAFRNRKEDDEDTSTSSLNSKLSASEVHRSPTFTGFGL